MGQTYSQNIARSAINSMVSVMNANTSKCSSSILENQQVNIVLSNPKGDVNINDINLNEITVISGSCLQSVSTDTQITQQIKNMAEQIGETIAQQFSLGDAETKNIIDNLINVGASIQNNVYQSCYSSVAENQGVNISVQGGNNVNISGINLDESTKNIVSCIQKASEVSEAEISIINSIEQKAVTKVMNTVFWILIAIAIVLGVLGLVATRTMGNWKVVLGFIIIITVIIIGYVIVSSVIKKNNTKPLSPLTPSTKS